jgi:hypothetical protein
MTLSVTRSGNVKSLVLMTAVLALSPVQGRTQGYCGAGVAEQQQLAYGGHNFDRPTDVTEDGEETSVMSAAPLLGRNFSSVVHELSCGRGRSRDAATGKCLGPADVTSCR